MNPLSTREQDDQDDLEAASRMLDDMGAKPFDYDVPEGLDGSIEALGGLLQPSAAAGRALMMTGAVVPIAYDAAAGAITGKPRTTAQDWYFGDVVEGLGNSATDYWKPDPVTMSSAARAINMVSNVVGSVPQIFGMPSVFLAGAGIDPATELTREGVDTKTSLAVGGVNLAVNAIGMKLPPAIGNSLATRMASGAGINAITGVAGDAASKGALSLGGYTKQAQRYDIADPYARGMDVLMGLAFGYAGHARAPGLTLAQRDAVLVARSANHIERGTMPGQPVTPEADLHHLSAISSAIDQLLRDERVDVAAAIKPEDFIVPEDGGYSAYRRALESGGHADARNRASSAAGIDQFTDATWRNIVARTKPAWAQGLSDAELLAARLDPAKSTEMVNALDAEHAAALKRSGLDASVHNLYAAHHFGINRAKAFARAADDTPMDRLLSAEQLDANPYLKGLTKAEAIANWDQRAARAGVRPDGALVDTDPAGQALRRRLVDEPDQLVQDYAALEDSAGGTILNTDTARELSPEYLADRTRSADVHEAASDFVKMLYERKLAEPTPEGFDRTVLFTAGGTGAGKTSGLKAVGDALGRPEIVYDTNMNTLRSAQQKVEQALAANREVTIVYVYRDPVEALTGGAIPRAQNQAKKFGTGRTVPLEEHAKTHAGVRGVMESLAEQYQGDPRVKIIPIDNSRGKGRQAVVPSLADLPEVEQNGLHERLREALEQARAAGLDERIYRGFAGQAARDSGLEGNRGPHQTGGRAAAAGSGRGNGSGEGGQARPGMGSSAGGQPEQGSRGQIGPETPVDALARVADESPQAIVSDGYDADGNPVYRPVAEALAEIEAERVRAEADSQAFTAAVSCFLRRGA